MEFSEHTYFLGALFGSAITVLSAYGADTPSQNLVITGAVAMTWAGTWAWHRYVKKGPRQS